MKKFILFLIVCSIYYSANSQHLDAYRIYKSNGVPISYGEMVKSVSSNDIILFGELHNNPISHWLQLELTLSLYNIKGDLLVLGAEMFESDNQLLLDEYFQGHITQGRFEAEARVWPNYKTDYKPIVEFARENNLGFAATNIPRRYASMVSLGGFESLENLSETALSYIAPLPIDYDAELPGYKAMLGMMNMPGKPSSGNDNFPKAQAVKDATMAWYISKNLGDRNIFLHFHGTYHSNNYDGIFWYLNKYTPNSKVTTIATVEQEKVDKLDKDNNNLADFIIVVPTRMTKTY